MGNDPQNQRKRKRLLVASLGVATVSFVSLQTGCEEGQMLPVALDASHDPGLASDALVPSANLLAPPEDAAMDALVTSGNLLPPPDGSLRDAAADAIVTSGNLLPPPDAAADAASKDAAQDARIDTGLPISGNLVPLPPRESR